jgi:hypothetical protein
MINAPKEVVIPRMQIDRDFFYKEIRKSLFQSIRQSQFQGMEAILDEAEKRGTDLRFVAYMLATAYHEVATTMQPIEEIGKGSRKPYGKNVGKDGQFAGVKYNRTIYTKPKKLYYGRGLVQLTWYENYEKIGKFYKLDLLNHPELVLGLNLSVQILFDGMLRGWFTGRKLSDYIGVKTNFVQARRIINILDKAELIASYANAFRRALKA